MAIATVFGRSFLDSLVTTPNSHLFLSVYSASSVVQKNHFSTAEARETQSKELSLCRTWDEEVI